MPTVRKYTQEEMDCLKGRKPNRRQAIEAEYDEYFAGFQTGEYGEAVPAEGETKNLVRRRLREAAKRAGYELRVIRTTTSTIRFQVVASSTTPDDEVLPFEWDNEAQPEVIILH